MTLSLKDRRGLTRLRKLQAIANFFTDIDNAHPTIRPVILTLSTHHVVVGHIVSRYTAMDALLNDIITAYFFGLKAIRIPSKAQKPKNLRIFRHHLLDETYLLKKLQIVHAIEPVPPKVSDHLRKLNAIRNAITHSSSPESRKEYSRTKKVTYAGRNIFTVKGLELFEADWMAARQALAARLPGHNAWMKRRLRNLITSGILSEEAVVESATDGPPKGDDPVKPGVA
ncbi:hypothetical protein M2232_002315 [Bradyrhizobium japonicum]|uniref:hypothetical protein n=1 Tax=Bradyrhizobium japonicum TaxID=375 RepID=UPI002227842E|nr:hypothetical protein [Bradyrhizobium japonicum]MCW2218783.1 hypothetical protein [Bradyrhizobium japonicum]MCW2343397.1 hypothetical protein [Bradyrhizobium japonicum]